MQSLSEAILAKVTQEIARRQELQRQEQEEAARIKQAEEMASTDALVLIQRSAGFRVDGWECRATYHNTIEGYDSFTVSLVRDSGHGFQHAVYFDEYLLVDSEDQVRFEMGTMTATHVTNQHGHSKPRKGLTDILEALIFAQFGELGPEAILECLNGEGL